MYKQHIFLNIYMHVCVYLYIHAVHTHILCNQKHLFRMWLIIWQQLFTESCQDEP